MQQVLTELKKWRDDINYDITQDWATPQERQRMLMQSTQLSICIGILEGIGINANIPPFNKIN